MDKHILIINADDFGATREINSAIVTCFKKEIINSTTIMVNMPYFNEAVELSFQNNFSDKIGIHINLTTGKPLTNINEPELVNEQGYLKEDIMHKPSIFFSAGLKQKIKEEIYAQYEKLAQANINCTHIDSHHHVHQLPWLAPLFIKLAKEKNQKVRVCMTQGKLNFFKTIYRLGLNTRLKMSHLNFTDIFGTASYMKEHLNTSKNSNRRIEVMVHPDIRENKLIDHYEPESFEYLRNLRGRYEPEVNNSYKLL